MSCFQPCVHCRSSCGTDRYLLCVCFLQSKVESVTDLPVVGCYIIQDWTLLRPFITDSAQELADLEAAGVYCAGMLGVMLVVTPRTHSRSCRPLVQHRRHIGWLLFQDEPLRCLRRWYDECVGICAYLCVFVCGGLCDASNPDLAPLDCVFVPLTSISIGWGHRGGRPCKA